MEVLVIYGGFDDFSDNVFGFALNHTINSSFFKELRSPPPPPGAWTAYYHF
jgi:hypothetical protein